MTASSGEVERKALDLGRHVYGFAAFAFGAIDLAWHDFNDWQQLRTLWSAPHGAALLYIAASAQVLGGIALQWRRSARWGAVVLGLVYLSFAGRWVPRIVAEPTIYDRWGNLFEQLSLVSAALIVYASAAPGSLGSSAVRQIGRYLFAVCVISFTLEQYVYLTGTAGFVPKWLPPGQMFWAVTTTIALALAAVSLLCGRLAIPASRWLTAMFMIFGLLVWLPRLLADPHDHTNWGGNAQNLAITGAAWIVADLLSRTHAAAVARRA
jgi:uncharacterized membrane protein YphA (DoxX/SURF4 family)